MSLDEADISRLRDIFVQKTDCDDKMSEADDRLDVVVTDMAVMKSQMKTLIGILTTIAIPVLAVAVKYLFGGA